MKFKIMLCTLAAAGLAALSARAVETVAEVPAFGVSDLIQATNKPYGREIILEGFPAAVCKRSGQKAWLHDTNSEAAGTIRVERTANMVAFNQELVGKTVRVTGVLRELRLDTAYFDAWEARLNASQKSKAGGEKEDGCTEQCQENVPADATRKIIAAYRKKLAVSSQGYLSAMWVDGASWTLVEIKPEK